MKTKFICRYDALDVATYALISLFILLVGFVIGFQSGEMYATKNQEDTPTIIYNEVDNIEYIGDMDSSIKEMKISNQGGLVVFRYAINNLGNYISNDDEQINHSELLKKLNVNK